MKDKELAGKPSGTNYAIQARGDASCQGDSTTDEEIAKESFSKHIIEDSCFSRKAKINIYKYGFLDGLAKGKPKWHEVYTHVKPSREIEKKYMPKANQRVMIKYHFYNDNEIHYSDGYYDCYDFEFHISNNPTGKIICAIAWCELPKFEN